VKSLIGSLMPCIFCFMGGRNQRNKTKLRKLEPRARHVFDEMTSFRRATDVVWSNQRHRVDFLPPTTTVCLLSQQN
jgi:hypothetical protein